MSIFVCVNVAISWCFHWIKADRRKEISFNRPDFVCFIPFVLHYPRSLYLADFFLSLSNASLVRRFPSFAYFLRAADSRYYSIAISLARPAFFRKLSRSRLDEAIAQMLTRPERSSAGGEIAPVIRLGTYICYICNWKLYHVDEINRSRRLLRNVDV